MRPDRRTWCSKKLKFPSPSRHSGSRLACSSSPKSTTATPTIIEDIRDTRLRNGTWTRNRTAADIGEPPVEGGDDAMLVDRQNLVLWSQMRRNVGGEDRGVGAPAVAAGEVPAERRTDGWRWRAEAAACLGWAPGVPAAQPDTAGPRDATRRALGAADVTDDVRERLEVVGPLLGRVGGSRTTSQPRGTTSRPACISHRSHEWGST